MPGVRWEGSDVTQRTRPRGVRRLALLALVLALAPGLAAAKEEEPPNGWHTAGSAFGTLFYSPVKIAYAATGVLVGGLAWAWSFGNKRVSRPIFKAALLGDYVVQPEHLSGAEKLAFHGR